MTTIKDLEEKFKSLEEIFTAFKNELEELKEENLSSGPESLFDRWATTSNGQRVLIVSDQPDEFGMVTTINEDPDRPRRNRNLVLVNLDVDPVVLTTEEDFNGAPEGTIVEGVKYPHDVYVKRGMSWDRAGYTDVTDSDDMSTCRVVRWGDEE